MRLNWKSAPAISALFVEEKRPPSKKVLAALGFTMQKTVTRTFQEAS